MDLNKFTEKASETVQEAIKLAQKNGQQQVEPEHLLLSLLNQEGGLAGAILRKAGTPVDSLHRRVQEDVDKLPKLSGGEDRVGLGSRMVRLGNRAADELPDCAGLRLSKKTFFPTFLIIILFIFFVSFFTFCFVLFWVYIFL